MHIKSAQFYTSAPDLQSCPESDLPEFAFIGRSNVGKSSLINMLAGKKDLARVSATPGHTKLINFFAINNAWHLVDLPGYGHAHTSKRDQEKFQQMIATYLTGRSNLACVFVLIDSRITPQQIDLDFLQWLEGYGVPFVLVFTKTDKLKPKQLKESLERFMSRMAECCQSVPKTFATSAEARTGRQELLAWINGAISQDCA